MYNCKISTHKCDINGISDYKSDLKQFDGYLEARRYLNELVKAFRKDHENAHILDSTCMRIRMRVEIENNAFIFFDGELEEV